MHLLMHLIIAAMCLNTTTIERKAIWPYTKKNILSKIAQPYHTNSNNMILCVLCFINGPAQMISSPW